MLCFICRRSQLTRSLNSDVLGQQIGALRLASLEGTSKRELSVDTVDTVNGVEVLDAGNLEAGGGTLTGGNRGVGKEVLPDAVPAGTVLSVDLILVAEPVAVPPPKGSRVVDTDCVGHLDLEAGTLKSVDNEAQRSRGVGTGEDVLVHEETPGEVLELPCLAETSDLKEESTIILKHVIDLTEERTQVTDTNVLSHLETCDLVVATRGNRDLTVIHAQNLRLILLNANPLEAVVAPGGLVAAKCDTSDVSAVVGRGELGKSSPTAANVEHLLAPLEADLLTYDSHLVVLKLFERLLLVDVGDDTGGVDHARAEEPAVEVVAAVVVVTDLFLVCGVVSWNSRCT